MNRQTAVNLLVGLALIAALISIFLVSLKLDESEPVSGALPDSPSFVLAK